MVVRATAAAAAASSPASAASRSSAKREVGKNSTGLLCGPGVHALVQRSPDCNSELVPDGCTAVGDASKLGGAYTNNPSHGAFVRIHHCFCLRARNSRDSCDHFDFDLCSHTLLPEYGRRLSWLVGRTSILHHTIGSDFTLCAVALLCLGCAPRCRENTATLCTYVVG